MDSLNISLHGNVNNSKFIKQIPLNLDQLRFPNVQIAVQVWEGRPSMKLLGNFIYPPFWLDISDERLLGMSRWSLLSGVYATVNV